MPDFTALHRQMEMEINFEGRLQLELLKVCQGAGALGPLLPEVEEITGKWDDYAEQYMADAWVEDYGVQNPAIYDCFPKFLKLSLLGSGDTMPNTIRKMTGGVADRFSIPERGYIKPGYYADITVFNEAALRDGQSDQGHSFGIEKVYINGNKVMDGATLDTNALTHTGRVMKN